MDSVCVALAAAGIVGGLVSAASDYVLGISKTDHDARKCLLSAWIGVFSAPAALCGFLVLSIELSAANETLGLIMKIVTYLSVATGLAVHIGIIEKLLLEYKEPALKDTIRDMGRAVLPPTVIFEVCIAVPLVLLCVAAAKGYLAFPPLLLILNPLTFVILFCVTRKLFKKPFPPGPMGLGLAGYALIALVAAL